MKILLTVLATLFACGGAVAQSPANWTRPTTAFQVIDTIYYVGSEGLSAWAIKTPAGVILLDVGMPANAAAVEDSLRALGFRLGEVKILLNSHAHFDHAGGLAKLKADTGAILVASAGDRPALEHGVYPGWESRRDFDFPPVKVDRVIGDGESVVLGGVQLTAVLTPGHSAGCTSYSMTVHDKGVAHQVLFFCSASVAANRLAPDPQYPGIVQDYRRTFAKLKAIKADILLAPHAEFFDLAARRARLGAPTNPFIDPAALPRLTAAMEAEFNRQLAIQTKAAGQNVGARR